MRNLGRTTAQLREYKRRWDALTAASHKPHASAPGRLESLADFGSNPGNLLAFEYVPETRAASAALVVVLHGCAQNAAGYDEGAGWSTLADRYGFALLLPEQQAANNSNLCFNWFHAGDTARGRGEALSIRQMVEAMVLRHGLDRRRIFVTGLSAGGAMTSVMLATYPDVFAGGAIIAGLPYGSARNVQEAFDSMFQGREMSSREWGDLVRAASPHQGPWPKVTIWHGSADPTVKAMNAGEIAKQWADLHGLPAAPTARDIVGGYPRESWSNGGETLIESYTITGMAHGTPVATRGEDAVGKEGPFLLEAGISSSVRIAQFWGLIQPTHAWGRHPNGRAVPSPAPAGPIPHPAAANDALRPSRSDIGSIITGALRSAGLIRD